MLILSCERILNMSSTDFVERWEIIDRITHLLNLLGILIAIISGLPQLQLTVLGFDLGGQFRWITDYIGGEGVRRILHRYVTTGLISVAIVLHVLSFGLRKTKSSILFTYKDLRGLVEYYKHKFLKAPKPILGFHVPGEKLLYWVVVTCIPVLGATGLAMWMRIFFLDYEILRLIHRIVFIVLTLFIAIHFILNIVFREQWQPLKAMFIDGRVTRKWVEQYHPKAIEEATSLDRRKTIKMFLWTIPLISLGYLFSTLLQASKYQVGEIIIEPSEVMVGKAFTISTEVTNTGYREDTFTLQLLLDGKPIGEKQITLLDGETDLVVFKATVNEVGRHTIEVNGVSKTFEAVEAPPPIEPEIAERFRKLLPEAYEFSPVMKEGKIVYYEVYNAEGMLIGYGFHEKVYAPTDRLILTGIVDLNYRIKAIDVDRMKPDIHLHNEKIIEPEFENQFIGLTIEEIGLYPEGRIDAVSGATISSTQVVELVRKALAEIQSSS